MIEEMLIKHQYPAPNLLRKIFFVRGNKKIEDKANGDSNIQIDLDKRIYTITKANGVNYASSHQKNEVYLFLLNIQNCFFTFRKKLGKIFLKGLATFY
jgi:hypothetical protein